MRRPRSNSSGSGASSSQGGGEHSSGSKLREILRTRKRVKKRPLKVVTRYRERMLAKMGITVLPNGTLSAPFAHPHVSLKLRDNFGKMVGLWRCHYAVGHILELLEHRELEQAAATSVQLLKALHQTALDQGSWSNSMLLLPWDDALRADLFGGDEDEMMAAAKWNRGIRDLQSAVAASSRFPRAQQDDASGDGPQGGQAPDNRAARRAAAAAKANAAAVAHARAGAAAAAAQR